MSAPFVLHLASGIRLAVDHGRTLIRVASGLEPMACKWRVMEVQLPPLTAGPNLSRVSRNRGRDVLYVLGGVIVRPDGQELRDIAAGGLAWGARGTAHAYANRADEPLRLLIQLIPAGAEELFTEMGAYLQNVDAAPDEEVTAAIMARYGATRVGPRISIP